jgi:LytS/YehU family sensor histidine kinase
MYIVDVCISTFLNVVTFYPIYLGFPLLLKFRSKFVSILSGIVILVLITALRVPAEIYFWSNFIDDPQKEMAFSMVYLWNNLRLVIIIGIYAILIRFMINWFESQKHRDELINKQQASELALIRSQVNPHFLFNTLNNIYSLVYRKSDEAPDALMKLSSIMRYMLHDSALQKVPLEKEVEYLKSFIELQNLRTKHPDFVSLRIEGNTDGWAIAPMLLISFVENAYKHSSKSHRPGILIHLTVVNGKLNFEVINYLKTSSPANDETLTGSGLNSLKRRLELIYPNNHSLIISRKPDTFRINLEISN